MRRLADVGARMVRKRPAGASEKSQKSRRFVLYVDAEYFRGLTAASSFVLMKGTAGSWGLVKDLRVDQVETFTYREAWDWIRTPRPWPSREGVQVLELTTIGLQPSAGDVSGVIPLASLRRSKVDADRRGRTGSER